jgi:hypothetical protein
VSARPRRSGDPGATPRISGVGLQDVGAGLQVERRRAARRERVAQLAGVEIERVRDRDQQHAARDRVDPEPLGQDRQPGRRLAVAGTGRRDHPLQLVLGLAVGPLRPQRAAGEPGQRGLVAQVDLRRDARVGEPGPGVEPPQQRGLGVQPHRGDRAIDRARGHRRARARARPRPAPRGRTPARSLTAMEGLGLAGIRGPPVPQLHL